MLHIRDLRHIREFDLPLMFDSFHADIQQDALDEGSRELNQPRIDRFDFPVTGRRVDAVMHGLALSRSDRRRAPALCRPRVLRNLELSGSEPLDRVQLITTPRQRSRAVC
jgi:hypothetical protein